MRKTSYLISTAVFLLASAAPASAEGEVWSLEASKEHPGIDSENRIIRWCSDDQTKSRYASANIQLKGYQPCGELNIPVNCDPSGQRLISKDANLPYAYKDCGVGPRIQMRRSAHEEIHSETPDTSVDPLSSREKSDLAKDVKGIEQAQGQDLEMQLQKMLDGIMGQMINQVSSMKISNKGARGGVKIPISDKDAEMLIRYVDPQQQDQLRQILKSVR